MKGDLFMEILITNKIESKINEYQEKTGATKTWIAKQLGISTQRLYNIINATNLQLDIAIKIALFLDCKLDDLFIYEYVD